jgi:acyl-CoA thioesterase
MTADDPERQRFCETVGAGMYETDRAAQALGIRLEEIRRGYARTAMTVAETMLNSQGTCHGGLIFTLADSAFGYACNAENKATVALACSISYTSAVRSGERLVAVAEERLRNARTGTYDITVTGADGRTVALFRGSSYQIRGETVPGLGTGPQRPED